MNFDNILGFLQKDIDDADIHAHVKDCTSLASDQFLKCIDEKLDTETSSRIIAAGD